MTQTQFSTNLYKSMHESVACLFYYVIWLNIPQVAPSIYTVTTNVSQICLETALSWPI